MKATPTTTRPNGTQFLERAKTALFDMDYLTSLQWAEMAVQETDASSEAYLFCGHLYEHFRQDRMKAAATYEQGLTRFPDDPTLLLQRGHLYAGERNWAKAAASFLAGLERQQDSDATQAAISCRFCLLKELGSTYAAQGEHQWARECWEEALRVHPMGSEANRLLRKLYLQEAAKPASMKADWFTILQSLEEFVYLWKLDHGILNSSKIIGTIGADVEKLDSSLKALHRHPGSNSLAVFAEQVDTIGLHDEALLLWRLVLQASPLNETARQAVQRLQHLEQVLEEYTEASRLIYANIAKTGQRKPRQDRQTLYTILRKMEPYCHRLADLPSKATRKTWTRLTSIYERHFRLHIRGFFLRGGLYGTYVSHLVNERYYLLDPSYNHSRFIFRELARDVEQSYYAWMWKYFGSAPAGWAGSVDRRQIYRCTDAFKNCMWEWTALRDAASQKQDEQRIDHLINNGSYSPSDVFHNETTRQLIRSRQSRTLYEQVVEELPPSIRDNEGAVKTAFFQRFYEHSLLSTLIRHEGPGALGPNTLWSYVQTFLFGLRRGLLHVDAAAEYKARALEMRSGLLPFETLRGISGRDLEAKSPFGRAHRQLLRHMFRRMQRNPESFPQIQTDRSLLLQLHLLSEEQVRSLAQSVLC